MFSANLTRSWLRLVSSPLSLPSSLLTLSTSPCFWLSTAAHKETAQIYHESPPEIRLVSCTWEQAGQVYLTAGRSAVPESRLVSGQLYMIAGWSAVPESRLVSCIWEQADQLYLWAGWSAVPESRLVSCTWEQAGQLLLVVDPLSSFFILASSWSLTEKITRYKYIFKIKFLSSTQCCRPRQNCIEMFPLYGQLPYCQLLIIMACPVPQR